MRRDKARGGELIGEKVIKIDFFVGVGRAITVNQKTKNFIYRTCAKILLQI